MKFNKKKLKVLLKLLNKKNIKKLFLKTVELLIKLIKFKFLKYLFVDNL